MVRMRAWFVVAVVMGIGSVALAKLPTPPRQKEPWTAPKDAFAAELGPAAAFMFEQGLADPRGCEYREIVVQPGSVWSGHDRLARVHGFVLPGEGKRFAIGWNGLVYPVIEVGPAVDLATDVREAVNKAGAQSIRGSIGQAMPERHLLQLGPTRAVPAALLLRLGQTKLAEECWNIPVQFAEGRPDCAELLASEWIWSLYDRAVCSHIAGDDELAQEAAKLCTDAYGAIDAELHRRLPKEEFEKEYRPFDYLKNLPILLKDTQRRLAEPKVAPALERLDQLKDQNQRIAALVHDLEYVSQGQNGQPGGVALSGDPIIEAPVKEGNAAVPALIEAFEKDERLTRSVSFHRDFFPSRHLIGVDEAAYVAVTHCLETDSFGPGLTYYGGERTAERRAALAAAMRAFYAKYKDKRGPERWYAMLSEDDAPAERWVEAAAQIVRPVDVEVRGGWISEPWRKPGTIPAMRGEELRKHEKPSVTELLVKRIQGCEAEQKLNLVLCLAQWDTKAGEPVLLKATRDARAAGDVHAVLRFVKAGEGGPAMDALLKEYAALLPSVKLDDFYGREALFEPIWKHQENADILAAVRSMLEDEHSPLMLCLTGTVQRDPSVDALDSHLIGIGVIRDRVIKMLRIGKSGKAGEIDLRDECAARLQALEGSPLFDRGGPEAQREQLAGEMARFLERYGDRFRYAPEQRFMLRPNIWHDSAARIRFPQLDQPATTADVEATRAIFSLQGDGEERVVGLPAFPMIARWPTRKPDASGGRREDGVGKSDMRHLNEGLVWQAEEVTRNGQTQRFYGFTGSHVIAKVPAEQIEFPYNWSIWAVELSGSIDCIVNRPGYVDSSKLGERMPVMIMLRNRAGLPQAIPTDFARREAGIWLRRGVEIHLQKEEPSADGPAGFRRVEMPSKIRGHFAPTGAAKVVEIGQSVEVLRCDLGELFDVRGPGSYWLSVHFSKESGVGEGESSYAQIEVR